MSERTEDSLAQEILIFRERGVTMIPSGYLFLASASMGDGNAATKNISAGRGCFSYETGASKEINILNGKQKKSSKKLGGVF